LELLGSKLSFSAATTGLCLSLGVLHGDLWLRAQSPLTRKPQLNMLLSPGCGQICQEFLPGSVLNITGASLVQAVLLSIPVISVRGTIEQLSVMFVPQVSQPIITPSLPSPNLPTPIRVDRLISLLSGYNHFTAEFLYSGFSFGFPIHFQGERVSSTAKNLVCAFLHPTVVDDKIRKELDSHRLASPFSFLHFIHSVYPPWELFLRRPQASFV